MERQRPEWLIEQEGMDGKRHDNPHHAGMTSHQRRMTEADQSVFELPEGVRLVGSALSAIKRITGGKK